MCRNCYQALWRLVKQRKTTWRKLQAEGFVLPSTRGRGKTRNPAAVRVIASLKSK